MNKAVWYCTTLPVETVGFLPILLTFPMSWLACISTHTHAHTPHTHTHTGCWEIHPPRTHMLHKQKPSCVHLRVLDYHAIVEEACRAPSTLKEHKKDFKP